MAKPRKKTEQELMDEIVRMLDDYAKGTPKRSETGSKVDIDDWGE
jgi:hypothetical protein